MRSILRASPLGVLAFAAPLAPTTRAVAQEHPEHPEEAKHPKAPPLTKETLAQAIRAHIEASLQEGYFLFTDPEGGEALKLTLLKVHEDKLASLGDQVYFACTDFRGTNAHTYDLDFFLKDAGDGKLTVTDTMLHKKDGKPRYLWKEEKGVWKRLPPPKSSEAPPAERTFRIVQTFRVERRAGADEADLYVPIPQDDPWQEVRNFSWSPAAPATVRDDRTGDAAVRYRVPPQGITVVVSYVVTRRERSADLAQVRAGPVPEETKRWLADDRRVRVDDRVREIARGATRGARTPFEKARAIYDYVLSHMRYEKKGVGWGRGDLVWACDRKYGNCTDFHSLLIGLLRASGIPARFQIGLPVPEGREGEIPGYHCWADFYVDGPGWVPVDASEAWKNPNRRDFFFGNLDPDRFALSNGRDVRFPGMSGPPINFFVDPYVEAGGAPAPPVTHTTRFTEIDRGA